jgi:hypothetical protein
MSINSCWFKSHCVCGDEKWKLAKEEANKPIFCFSLIT